MLRRLLLDDANMREHGCVLRIGKEHAPVLVFIDFGNFLSDEAALKSSMNSKGASGLFCCWKCDNVCAIEDEDGETLLEHDDSGTLVNITCNQTSRFHTVTDEASFVKADVLTSLFPLLQLATLPMWRSRMV